MMRSAADRPKADRPPAGRLRSARRAATLGALVGAPLLLLAACSDMAGPDQPGGPGAYNDDEFTGDSNQSGSNHPGSSPVSDGGGGGGGGHGGGRR